MDVSNRPTTVPVDIAGASTVLVETLPDKPTRVTSGITDLAPRDPAEMNVLVVSLRETADEVITAWKTQVDARLPSNMGVIEVGGGNRSAAAETATNDSIGTEVTVSTISDPHDLSTLGIRLVELSSAWKRSPQTLFVCVDSLSRLLDYTDCEPLFRFLHTLKGHIAQHDGVAHIYVDPTAIDERTHKTLSMLMDVIVEENNDGTWSARTR